MYQHRFRDQQEFGPVSAVPVAVPTMSAFLACPAAVFPGWIALPAYQWAYERAQEVVRPSRLERLQAVLCN